MQNETAVKMNGLPCPKCGTDTMVIDSRASADNTIRRRRQCEKKKCGHRFTTYERMKGHDARPAVAMLDRIREVMQKFDDME